MAQSESEAVERVCQLFRNFITVQRVGPNKIYKRPRFITNQLEKRQTFLGGIKVPQVAFDDRETLEESQKILKYRAHQPAYPRAVDSFNHVLKIRSALSERSDLALVQGDSIAINRADHR